MKFSTSFEGRPEAEILRHVLAAEYFGGIIKMIAKSKYGGIREMSLNDIHNEISTTRYTVEKSIILSNVVRIMANQQLLYVDVAEGHCKDGTFIYEKVRIGGNFSLFQAFCFEKNGPLFTKQ